MSKHGLRILILIIFYQCFIAKLQAQTKINSCLYIGAKDRYVLTENIKLDDGKYQSFNSLFIWEPDKVIRIVFLYDKKLALVTQSDITRLRSFKSFLPTFKKCTWHENPKRRIFYGVEIYDQTFTDKREDETDGRNYGLKLKTVINARNKKYNPLADKFGSIMVLDGDPEVMIYNDKRKGKNINNLPLLFNSAKGDSSYIISPIHIDVYRVDNSEKNENRISREFTGYQLYSSVSFLKESVKYPTAQSNEEAYKWPLKNIIEGAPLYYLYRPNLAIDTGSLMTALVELPLSDRKYYYYDNISPEPIEVIKRPLSKKDSIRIIEQSINRKEDSIKWREAVKMQFFKGDNFNYQYCAECYDAEISKKARINKHCPFKMTVYKGQYIENWSYAFYDKYRAYFKVEGPDLNKSGIISSQQEDVHKWFLMSPGIGYWMSDVDMNHDQYSINKASLFLNGEKIRNN
jgi:hypothetical protein